MGRVELDFDVATWLSPSDSMSQFWISNYKPVVRALHRGLFQHNAAARRYIGIYTAIQNEDETKMIPRTGKK